MGSMQKSCPVKIWLLATPIHAASGLFGLFDALSSVGVGWETFVTGEPVNPKFDVRIVAKTMEPFICASNVRITPDHSFDDACDADIIIVSGTMISALEPMGQKYAVEYAWLKKQSAKDTRIAASCSGAVFLAEAGMLNGEEATTHWAYDALMRKYFPEVVLRLDRNLCFRDAKKGVVTTGGTTAWQELALFLIVNYASLEDAARTAKFFLLSNNGDLQAPFMSIPLSIPHADAAIHASQEWISANYQRQNPVAEMVQSAKLAQSTFSRRFRSATGYSPKDYVHLIRTEEAKQLLETTNEAIDSVAEAVGYNDPASFRRIFKRHTGLVPSDHRRMFGQPRFERYK